MNYLDLRRSEKRMIELAIEEVEREIKKLTIREKRIRKDLANPDNTGLMAKVVLELCNTTRDIEILKYKRHHMTDKRLDIIIDIFETELELASKEEKEKL